MSMSFKPIMLLGTATMISILLTGCSSSETTADSTSCTPKHADITTTNAGSLTVGVTDLLPFSSNTDSGATGVDIDVLTQIAQQECLALSFQPATVASAIPLISQQGSIDLTTGAWYPTAEREKIVSFAGPLYTDSMGIISASGISTVSDLESLKSVGTVEGYLWTDDLKSVLGDKLKTYASSVELQQDLANGRLDAAVDSYGASKYALKNSDFKVEISTADTRVAASVNPAQTIFPMTKDNSTLKSALDEDILEMRTDGSLGQILEDNGLSRDIAVPAEEELNVLG